MADGNPFGAPPAAAYNPPAASGNPFDPMAPSAQATEQNPFSAPPQPTPFAAQPSSESVASTSSNPFGAPVVPPQPVAATTAPFPQYGAPSPAAPSPQGGYPAYGAVSSTASASSMSQQPPFENAMVPSQQPSNPYGGIVAPGPYSSSQAIVPSAQQTNQWAIGAPPRPAAPVATSSSASFDPFAPPPPAPAPAPEPPMPVAAPAPVPFQQQPDSMVPQAPPPQEIQPVSSFGGASFGGASQPHAEDHPLGSFGDGPSTVSDTKSHEEKRSGPDRPVEDNFTQGTNNLHSSAFEFGQRENPQLSEEPRAEDEPRGPARNPYSGYLARQAPPGASPLPKANLVRKKGYVLARISFRTIVMKKWKQTYWVQYGPHTMLWFRSESDFNDWLNNPYHDQAQRNFLIKLAVNFVHDLYKPNVRGYQVTQSRTKAYGNKMIRQFKLERWMDYGPTIAAAFGSYNPREVDELREAIVECMRNTPLNSGIRATGAVRQREHERHREREDDYSRDGSHSYGGDSHSHGGHTGRSFEERPDGHQQNGNVPGSSESVAEEADLLDVDNWDDVPLPNPPQQSAPQYVTPTSQGTTYAAPQPAAATQQYPPQQQPPPQQPYQNAMVPVNAPQAYPGAPPVPQQAYPGAPPASPQQSYPGAPPASPQQTYPGAPPASPQQSYSGSVQQQQQDPWAAPPAGQQPYAPQPQQAPQFPPQQQYQPQPTGY